MDPTRVIAPAKPASTLMALRDSPEGIEVLMVKRNRAASFMGGVWVFPGGRVDEEDDGAVLRSHARGRTEQETSAQLGIDAGGLGFWISAVRELFEESGLLLATSLDGTPIALEGDVGERFAAHRAAINRRERSFEEVVVAEELVLDLAAIHHVDHWITPEAEQKRFDTHFFIARAPEGQTPLHDEGETVAAEWVTPADALRRHRAGEIRIVLPTIRNLRILEEAGSVDELVARSSELSARPMVMPRMIMEADGPTLLAPDDEGYLGGPPNLWDAALFPEAVRRRARKENPPLG
jgi:8-oxo-dGTP pyrophosphatase MutT (NUDIX family)